jgi:hypothetical protein
LAAATKLPEVEAEHRPRVAISWSSMGVSAPDLTAPVERA